MKKILSVLGATLGLLLYAAVIIFFFALIINDELLAAIPVGLIILLPIIIILAKKRFKMLLALALTILLTTMVYSTILMTHYGWIAMDHEFGYSKNDDGTITVSSNNLSPFEHHYKDIVIPSSFRGKEVTGVELCLKKDVKSIVVPATVKNIKFDYRSDSHIETLLYEGSLSEWCETVSVDDLSRVDKLYIDGSLIEGDLMIPDDVTKINDSAFAGYSKIRGVTFGENSNLVSIGEEAFYNCEQLRTVNFEADCKLSSIGDNAFAGCEKIFSFTLPENLMYLGKNALPDDLIEIYNLSTLSYDDADVIHKNSSAKSVIENVDGYLFVAVGDSSNKLLLLDYIGYGENLHIPELGADKIVIYKNAFLGCESIVTVTIPSNVTSIGEDAFYNCDSLTGVVIGDGVTTIGDSAFYSCSSLTSVVIGENVTHIGNNAFSGCSGLVSVAIPDSVTFIGNYAFYNCYSLTEIVIPDSVTSIGNYAFYNCYSLQSIVIGKSVDDISYDTFAGCNAVKNIEIDKNNPKYYSEANCIVEKDTYTVIKGFGNTMPHYVKYIGEHAFSGCDFESIIISNSVISIGKGAFSKCELLSSVTFSEGNNLKEIQDYAFFDCKNLSNVILPESLEYLGYSSFDYDNVSTSYKGIEYMGTVNNPYKIVVDMSDIKNLVLHEDAEIIAPFALSNIQKAKSLTVTKNVYLIYDSAFTDAGPGNIGIIENKLSKIIVEGDNQRYYSEGNCLIEKKTDKLILGCKNSEIPNSVKFIGAYAFYNCDGLTDITIPNSVISIGEYAFRDCDSLTSVVIGNSVTTIGSYAFYDCDSLTSVVIPDSVTTIGSYAFYDCDSLTSVVIPDSVTTIGSYAFYYCDSLTDVYYTGTEEEWFANFGWGHYFGDATIHFNYVPEE